MESKIIFYADDTVLYTSGRNVNEAIKRLQNDLTNLQSWYNRNGLHINANKTKYVIFSNKTLKTDNIQQGLSIENKPLQRVPSYNYLGVSLDEHLTFENHANQTIDKVAPKIFQL